MKNEEEFKVPSPPAVPLRYRVWAALSGMAALGLTPFLGLLAYEEAQWATSGQGLPFLHALVSLCLVGGVALLLGIAYLAFSFSFRKKHQS